ncbi:MAG: hypothetical protein Q7S44_04410 [bacterium]|nr:hypothetical protein [bacterium]
MKKEELTITPEKVAEIVAQASYDLWKDEEFRKMVNFETLSQTEQDRIFNELEVTLLGLVFLQAEQQPLLLDTQKKVIDAF